MIDSCNRATCLCRMGSRGEDARVSQLYEILSSYLSCSNCCLYVPLQDGEQRRGEGWDEKEPTGAPHPVAPNSGRRSIAWSPDSLREAEVSPGMAWVDLVILRLSERFLVPHLESSGKLNPSNPETHAGQSIAWCFTAGVYPPFPDLRGLDAISAFITAPAVDLRSPPAYPGPDAPWACQLRSKYQCALRGDGPVGPVVACCVQSRAAPQSTVAWQ
jgi:hypothetical protein